MVSKFKTRIHLLRSDSSICIQHYFTFFWQSISCCVQLYYIVTCLETQKLWIYWGLQLPTLSQITSNYANLTKIPSPVWFQNIEMYFRQAHQFRTFAQFHHKKWETYVILLFYCWKACVAFVPYYNPRENHRYQAVGSIPLSHNDFLSYTFWNVSTSTSDWVTLVTLFLFRMLHGCPVRTISQSQCSSKRICYNIY